MRGPTRSARSASRRRRSTAAVPVTSSSVTSGCRSANGASRLARKPTERFSEVARRTTPASLLVLAARLALDGGHVRLHLGRVLEHALAGGGQDEPVRRSLEEARLEAALERRQASADRRGLDPKLLGGSGERARPEYREKIPQIAPLAHACSIARVACKDPSVGRDSGPSVGFEAKGIIEHERKHHVVTAAAGRPRAAHQRLLGELHRHRGRAARRRRRAGARADARRRARREDPVQPRRALPVASRARVARHLRRDRPTANVHAHQAVRGAALRTCRARCTASRR